MEEAARLQRELEGTKADLTKQLEQVCGEEGSLNQIYIGLSLCSDRLHLCDLDWPRSSLFVLLYLGCTVCQGNLQLHNHYFIPACFSPREKKRSHDS